MTSPPTIPSAAEDELIVLATLYREGQAVLDSIAKFYPPPRNPLELFYEATHAEVFKRLEGGILDSRPMELALFKKHSADVEPSLLVKVGPGEGCWMGIEDLEERHLPALVKAADERRLFKRLEDLRGSPTVEVFEAVKAFEPTPSPKTGNRVHQALEEAVTGWEYASQHPGVHTGIDSGLVDLDKVTWGWQPENLIVVGGRPSQGKSSLLAGFAMHAAIELKIPTLFFSLESSANEIVRRMACSLARVPHQTMREGEAVKSDYPKLTSAISRIRNAPLHINDTQGLNASQMRTIARGFVKENGIKLILVDYLQKMRADAKHEKRTYEVAQSSEGLKWMATELHLPIIAAAQLNRESEKSKYSKKDDRDKAPPTLPPRLADLRDSGSIEQDADVVILIWHKPDVSWLMVAKNRDGETKNVKTVFLREITRFENASKIDDEDVKNLPNYDHEHE